MKKLISIILTTALTLSMFSCANCFADKSTTAQSKTIHIKTSSLNETRNAVDKAYGSIPRKTSILKKVLGATAAVFTSILGTFAVFKTFIQKYSNDQDTPDILNMEDNLAKIDTNTDSNYNPLSSIPKATILILGACILIYLCKPLSVIICDFRQAETDSSIKEKICCIN